MMGRRGYVLWALAECSSLRRVGQCSATAFITVVAAMLSLLDQARGRGGSPMPGAFASA